MQIAISQARRLATWLEMNGVSAQKKTAALDVHERCYYGRPCGVFFLLHLKKMAMGLSAQIRPMQQFFSSSRNEVLKYTNWCIVVPLVVFADVQKDR